MVMVGLFSDEFWRRLIDEFDSLGEGTQKPRPTIILMHLMTEIAINSFLEENFSHKNLLTKGFDRKIDFLYEEKILEEDTKSNLYKLWEVRCIYAHIRNLDDLDPDGNTVDKILDSIIVRHESQKRTKPYRNLSHRMFNVFMHVMLDQLQEDFVSFEDLQKMKRERNMS